MEQRKPEYLVLSTVPTDPARAKLMQARIARGEVEPHPDYQSEILAMLDKAVAGKLAAEADEKKSSDDALFNIFSKNHDIADAVKTVSAVEIESALAEYFQRKCNCEVNVNIKKITQAHVGSPFSPDIEFSIEFKVAAKNI